MRDDFKINIEKRLSVFRNLADNSYKNVEDAIALMKKNLKTNKVLIFGNGGSATQSSHFAAELVNRFYKSRPAINAIALTTDTANITSISNDYDFSYIFSRQIEAIGQENDIAFGITTSGKSVNVINALKSAKKTGMKTIALCGKNKDEVSEIADIIIEIDEDDTPTVQEVHLFILHFIAEQLEILMFQDK